MSTDCQPAKLGHVVVGSHDKTCWSALDVIIILLLLLLLVMVIVIVMANCVVDSHSAPCKVTSSSCPF